MFNLQKGARFAMTKDNPGLSKINFAAGWRENNAKTGDDFDVDLSLALIRDRKPLTANDVADVLYFNSNKSDGRNWDDKTRPYPFILDGAIAHSGDDRKGKEGDVETIKVDISKIPANVSHIVPFINIHQAATRRQNFGLISNAFIRIDNGDTNVALAEFKLSDDFYQYNGVIPGYFERDGSDWRFVAKSLGLDGDIEQIATSIVKVLQL